VPEHSNSWVLQAPEPLWLCRLVDGHRIRRSRTSGCAERAQARDGACPGRWSWRPLVSDSRC